MIDEEIKGCYQLQKGIYVNSHGESFCMLDGRYVVIHVGGKHRVFAFGRPNSCNDEGELTITTPFQNYCDANGNKIECIRINAVHSLTIVCRGCDCSIVELEPVFVKQFTDVNLPSRFKEINEALGEQPIKVQVVRGEGPHVRLNISNDCNLKTDC